jgi:phthalate 4,5-dioxygenase oxygenase subunit
MLTREENELLCRVGPGTPMGEMLREYWIPALRSEALEADGAPVRVRLMGENFVAFRATDGRVGLFDEGCPHRCTSLALARNEDNALTCIFHGWKIDVTGKVVDVPSEPPERRAEFAAKVRVRHYPVREAGTIIWVYLGKRDTPPKFYNFTFNELPASHVFARRAVMHCNWFQGLEAVLDSAHLGIMHQGWIGRVAINSDLVLANTNTGPTFEFLMRPYGFREGALRPLADGSTYARIREVVLPFFSFIPNSMPTQRGMICAIPIDDEWNAQWYIAYDWTKPISQENRDQMMQGTSGDPNNFCSDMGGWDNMWGQDRKAMKEGHFTGIMRCVPYEDFIAEESMYPVVDRTREYLGSSDVVIIRSRRMLLEAARGFKQGKPAPWQDDSIDFDKVRAIAIRFKGMPWTEIDSFNPPEPLPPME